jgi:septal ring factor EnvC (AmiA/AmiB activator)
LSTELQRLEGEIKDLTRKKEDTERELKQLRAREDVSAGVVYPARIHELQQEKLRLEVEIQRRRNLANRMHWEGEIRSGHGEAT